MYTEPSDKPAIAASITAFSKFNSDVRNSSLSRPLDVAIACEHSNSMPKNSEQPPIRSSALRLKAEKTKMFRQDKKKNNKTKKHQERGNALHIAFHNALSILATLTCGTGVIEKSIVIIIYLYLYAIEQCLFFREKLQITSSDHRHFHC